MAVSLLGCSIALDATSAPLQTRAWIAYVLAVKDVLSTVEGLEVMQRLQDEQPELHFAIVVLVQIMRSWIYRLEDAEV